MKYKTQNATFTAFLFRFILIIFSHTLSTVLPEMPWLSLYSPGSFNCHIFCRKPLVDFFWLINKFDILTIRDNFPLRTLPIFNKKNPHLR